MTTAARPVAESVMKMPSFGQALPYALGGLGIAALENRFIAPEIPPELKKVNLGIGGITGYLLTSPDPKIRFAALASVPTKQLGLFGIGAVDKLRRQQQSLVDANLGVAQVNRSTAEMNRDNAAATGRRALMFLIPALAAGGAIGYMGYERWKKRKSQIPRYQTMGQKGISRGGQKIKIDVPASALPPEFFNSLINVDDSPRSRTRFMELSPGADVQPLDKAASEGAVKLASTMDEGFSLPGFALDVGKELTGIPGAYRTAKDIGMGSSAYTQDHFGEAARYGAGALGNAAMTMLALKTGLLPIAGKVMGKRYMANKPTLQKHVRPFAFAESIQSRNSPGFGGGPATTISAAQRIANRKAMGLSTASPMRRLLNIKGRVDPQRFAWAGSTSQNPLFKQLFTFRPPGAGGPSTIAGHIYNTARFGGNKLWNAAYRGRKFMTRHPILSLMALGLPLASLGTDRDKNRMEAAQRSLSGWVPDWKKQQGPLGIPVSAQLSGLMSAFGGGSNRTAVRDQMQGANWDPWASMRVSR